jgi:hypothetical protein
MSGLIFANGAKPQSNLFHSSELYSYNIDKILKIESDLASF